MPHPFRVFCGMGGKPMSLFKGRSNGNCNMGKGTWDSNLVAGADEPITLVPALFSRRRHAEGRAIAFGSFFERSEKVGRVRALQPAEKLDFALSFDGAWL